MVLICVPEVLTHLLTPILPYFDITNARCQMRHFRQNGQKGHIWHICHLTHVIYRYGNMGVKRCVRTSRMQTNAIKQLGNRFNVLKFQNTDFQSFPLYFSKFPNINSGVCVCRRVCRQVCRQIISNVCQFRLFRPFMDPTPFSTLPPQCSGSSTQFASTSEIEKVPTTVNNANRWQC